MLTILGEYLNWRQEYLAAQDLLIFGTSYLSVTDRHKYNPMRYLLGKEKKLRIHPKKILFRRR